MDQNNRPIFQPAEGGTFATTHWSVVLKATGRSSDSSCAAADRLCRLYWPPLYAYIRRSGKSPEDAKDLTQGFFAHIFQRQRLTYATPERGRFRTFMITALRRYLGNHWRHCTREKRGGNYYHYSLGEHPEEYFLSRQLTNTTTPEQAYERLWAIRFVETAFELVRQDYIRLGQLPLFEAIREALWGDEKKDSYKTIADQLETTESAVKTSAYRVRARYRLHLRRLVADTLPSPTDEAEIDAEIRHIMSQL
jgi:RNA polymerase sigma factor (sigma-70 family)